MDTRRSQEIIVDTTLIAAPSPTNTKEDKRDPGKCKARAISSLALICYAMASQLWDAACCLGRGKLRGAVPGQEVVNPGDQRN